MGDEENQLKNPNSGDRLKHSQANSSEYNDSLPKDSEPYPDKEQENGDKDDDDFSFVKIRMFIWSALSACTLGLLIASLTVNKLKNSLIWDFKLWKWCLLLAIIIHGVVGIFLLAKTVEWLIIKFWHNGIVLYYFVGVKKAMGVFIWVSLIAIAWFVLFDCETKLRKDIKKTVNNISRANWGFVIGAGIWLGKTVLVKLIASFHVKILFEKVKSRNNRCKILKSLWEMTKNLEYPREEEIHKPLSEKKKTLESLWEKKKNLESLSEEDEKQLESLLKKNLQPLSEKEMKNLESLSEKKNHEFLSEEEKENLESLLRRKKKFDSLPEKEKKNLEKKKEEENTEDLIDVIKHKRLQPLRIICGNKHEKIKDENGAKNAANEIFKSFAFSDDGRIAYLKTILEFLDDEEERQHFIAVAEKKQKSMSDIQKGVPGDEHDGFKDIKKSVLEEKQIKRSIFRNWVVDIFRQYESANNALKNKKSAVDELNKLASVVVLMVIMIVWLLFMDLLSSRTIFFICSQLVLVAFMFGNTAKSIFEAIIFVFVMHPFDVGDRCIVDDVEVIVDQMEIMSTTFFKYDNAIVYYPNSELATKPITNLFRSPPMLDTFEFTIDLSSTPEELNDEMLQKKLDVLETEIEKYIKESPRRWGDHSVQYKEIEDTDKLKVALYVNHKINFHDAARRSKRRSKLVIGMKKIFKKLELKCTKFNVRYKASS